jgi:prepilin-type processing-associated H-X9-DG protein
MRNTRSFSISARMNGPPLPGAGVTIAPFTRVTSIVDPSPSQAVVFMDENSSSISFTGRPGQFYVSDSANGTAGNPDSQVELPFPSVPAVRHGGSASVSFADGHEELHKWMEPSTALIWTAGTDTVPNVVRNDVALTLPGPNNGPNRDIRWLQQRYWPSGFP